MSKLKIAILDGYNINPGDLSWSSIEELCDFIYYPRTSEDELKERLKNLDGIFVSKCQITRELMEKNSRLKFIGITATGYDNVDLEAAKSLGIKVYNVPGYSTEAVAQHTIALLLELTNKCGRYNDSVKAGDWARSEDFCYMLEPITSLTGKSIGIVGYGSIGRRVASICQVLGMTVNIYSKDREATIKSDFLSLHCPLAENTYKMINEDFISHMKDGAYLINTARGPLIDEIALLTALESGKLAGAALDVLTVEPPSEENRLLNHPRTVITPHIAWMPRETRALVIDICAKNLQAFLENKEIESQLV